MTTPDVGVTEKLARVPDAGIARPHWRWPISYRSIETVACLLDGFLIVTASMSSGLAYSQFALGTEGDATRFIATGAVVGAVFVPVMKLRGLYDPGSLLNRAVQFGNVALCWVATFLFFLAMAFGLKIGSDFSRGAVISFAVAGLAALLLHRVAWGAFIRSALANGNLSGRRAVVVSAGGRSASVLARDLSRHGVSIDRVFNVDRTPSRENSIEQVIAYARGSRVEEVFFAVEVGRWAELRRSVEQLRVLPMPVTLIPDTTTIELFDRTAHKFGEVVGLEFQRAPLSTAELVLKRTVDIVCGATGILLLLPLLVLTSVIVKLDSSGPILFRQTRHGFNGKAFKILKFRTMFVLEDGDTIRQASRDDGRVTRIGAWLRRTSIDELPQLFNVLMGDMSIVGPRPHAAAHDHHFENVIGKYAYRHHVKPGITGWAQVNGFRGETPTIEAMKARVDLDIWYVNNWSLLLDAVIILRTLAEVFRARNAY